jgi:2,4-diaminopentanoate dehydrogenase
MTMDDKVLRVAVISTGWISSLAIRAIARRPHLELVGVWVHSAEKTGRDAGEIVGLGPIGVTTTNDLDDIIALKPDCVVYGAASAEMDAAAVRDYVRLLHGGLNVVTTNTPGMMFPDRWIPELADTGRCTGRWCHHLYLGHRTRLCRRPIRGSPDDIVEHHPLDSRARDF